MPGRHPAGPMAHARMNDAEPSANEPAAAAPPPSRLRGCLYALLPVGLAALMFLVIPYLFIATLFWAADGDWHFEGRGFRHWLFVKGSRLESLGLVEATEQPVKYSIGLQEGNFPGWSNARYESTAQPFDIVLAYAERCRALKLAVIDGPRPDSTEDGGNAARLTCEIEKYLDVQVYAERADGAALTEVSVRVWGSE